MVDQNALLNEYLTQKHTDGPGTSNMEHDSRNHCCCGKIHIMTGCKIVGAIEVILLVFSLFSIISEGYVGYWWHFAVSLVLWFLWAFVVYMLFRGLSKRTARHLAPHLLLQLIYIVLSVISIVVLVFAVIFNSDALLSIYPVPIESTKNSDESIRQAAAITLAAFLIQVLVQIWIWSIVYKCYQFLKRENEFGPLVDAPTGAMGADAEAGRGGPGPSNMHDMYDKDRQQF